MNAAFYPPRVSAAPKPLRFPFNLVKLLSNNLELIPEAAYEKPLVIAPGPPRMAFLMDPDLVKEVLLTRASDFPKGGLQVEVLKPVFGNAMISAEGTGVALAARSSRAGLPARGVAALWTGDDRRSRGRGGTRGAQAPPESVHPIHADMMRTAFDVISTTMLAGGAEEVLEAIQKGHSLYYASANWWVLYSLLGLPHWLPRPRGHGNARA